MPLLDGTVDDLIIAERKNIEKYIAGPVEFKIVFDKKDQEVLNGMEEMKIWLEKRL